MPRGMWGLLNLRLWRVFFFGLFYQHDNAPGIHQVGTNAFWPVTECVGVTTWGADSAVASAIPSFTGIPGIKDQLAPSVINCHRESIDVIPDRLENIIPAVPVRGKCRRQIKIDVHAA